MKKVQRIRISLTFIVVLSTHLHFKAVLVNSHPIHTSLVLFLLITSTETKHHHNFWRPAPTLFQFPIKYIITVIENNSVLFRTPTCSKRKELMKSIWLNVFKFYQKSIWLNMFKFYQNVRTLCPLGATVAVEPIPSGQQPREQQLGD